MQVRDEHSIERADLVANPFRAAPDRPDATAEHRIREQATPAGLDQDRGVADPGQTGHRATLSVTTWCPAMVVDRLEALNRRPQASRRRAGAPPRGARRHASRDLHP